MSDSLKQSQSAGDNSTNLQAQHIEIHHHGLTVEEARQEFMALFEANFCRLQSEARRTAEERAGEITERFLAQQMRRNPAGLLAAQDPDMQAAIFTAQKAYARTGDRDLSELLVDILVERASQRDRTLKQIVLNESLAVVPKLTPGQFDILSLSFIVRYARRINLGNLADLTVHIGENILPFCANIPKHHAPYQHLQYAGCASIDIGEVAIGGIFFNVYPGLFSSGFSREEFVAAVGSPEPWIGTLLIPCLHNPALLQVSALGLDDIDAVCHRFSVPLEHRGKIKELQINHRMSQQAVEGWLKANVLGTDILLDVWNDSPLKHLTLASVGIAIAHANIRRKLRREDYNLDIWLP